MSEEKEKDVSRRDFMRATIAGIGGLITAAYAFPAVAYVLGPALQKNAEELIPLGSVSKIELGVPTLFKTTVQTQTGWISAEEEISAYVLTEDGQTFVVMSNVCTHLGCRIRWIAEENQFFCPCHNAAFTKKGEVAGGPPPRPLDKFEYEVQNDVLYIKRKG